MTDHTPAAAPLLDAARTGMLASYWARQQPDVPAVISEAGDRTFSELNAKANQLARALRRRGVGRGDAVALLCLNRPEFAEVLAATQRIGARFTPINWHLTAEEAGYVVDDCDAVVFVADACLRDLATQALRSAPRATLRLAIGGDIADWESYDATLDREDADDLTDPCVGRAQ